MRAENEELRKKLSEFTTLENAKKKLELKVEHLERKVSLVDSAFHE